MTLWITNVKLTFGSNVLFHVLGKKSKLDHSITLLFNFFFFCTLVTLYNDVPLACCFSVKL